MGVKLGSVALFALGLLGALAYACLWVPSAFMGRLQGRGGLALLLWPGLALLFSAAAALVPLALLQTDDLAILGRPSVPGWSVFAISLLAPLLAVVALAIAARPPRDANRLSRVMAVFCALLAGVACLYLAMHGWAGLRIWNA
jgi:hypothetical protein